MAEQSSDAHHSGRSTSETTFRDHKKEIAERNERVQKEARELRAARELEQLGITSRRQLDING